MTKIISTSTLNHVSADECSIILKKVKEDFPEVTLDRLPDTQSLFPLLANPEFYTDYVMIDIDEVKNQKGLDIFELVHTLSTLIKCTVHRSVNGKTEKRNTKIIGLVRERTPVERIKEAMEFKEIDYIMPGYGDRYTYEMSADSFRLILNGVAPRIDPAIKKQITQEKKKSQDNPGIKLTARQTQILNIINSRGASNKVIARMLNISESTVKLHVGAILKKYGVRNRTQLAIFSKENAKDKT